MTKDNGPSGATLGKTLGKALACLPAALGEIMTLSPIALGIALIALGAWWYEHGAHLKQAGELHELEKQTAGNISQLRARAGRRAELSRRLSGREGPGVSRRGARARPPAED